MPFHIDDSAISGRLQSLREAVGAQMADFRPNRFQIVDVIIPASEVEALFSPSGLLVRDNRPVFAYIRDHTERTLWEWGGPEAMKKLHFSVCQKLLDMKARKRFDRYRITNATSNKYAVDVRADASSWRDDGVQEDVRLHPCRYCLGKVNYHCYRSAPDEPRTEIVREFNSQEAMDMLWQWFDFFRQEVSNLRTAHSPTGYADNWPRVARAFKQRADWKCDSCGASLSHAKHLLDVHHVNGDKRNNSDDNLRCLCKDCHSKEHHHYHVSHNDLQTIKKARRQLV